jgi:hypothetical protein
MRRAPVRHRLGLMLVMAGLILLFVWDSVHGQGFRPRGPGMPPRPPFGGGMGPRFEFVNVCSKCGKEVGGKTLLDTPSSCPHCGVRFSNGGFGSGNRGGGNPGMPPAGMPGMSPMNPGLAPQNPAPVMPPQIPNTPIQPQAPLTPPQAPESASGGVSSSPAPSASASSKWLIPGVLAIVVMGLLGVGGIWIMISSLKGDNSPPRRSRSRRSRDDDYDD